MCSQSAVAKSRNKNKDFVGEVVFVVFFCKRRLARIFIIYFLYISLSRSRSCSLSLSRALSLTLACIHSFLHVLLIFLYFHFCEFERISHLHKYQRD